MEDKIFLFEFDLCSLRHGRDVPLWRLVIIYFGPFQTSYSGKACHNNVDTGCFHAHTAAGRILTHPVYTFDQKSASLHRIIPTVYVGVKL